MAKAQEEKFSCSICLDLLKDPVSTSCGHNYCMSCLKAHWDEEEERKKVYSCPQCRKAFTPRPDLEKCTMISDLVEQLKKTGLQAAPPPHCYAGAEDVACDVCTGRKLKALKSCLVCVASYCETHLQPHFESAAFKKHKLVEPGKELQENLCPRHDEVMKIFCRTDQQIICYLCSMDEHKGHDTVSAAAEREKKQQELDKHQKNLQQRIQDRDKDLKLLQQEVEAINRSADEAVEDSQEIFTQLIRLMEQRRSEVKQQIRSQQETEVSRVKELQEKLKQEMAELKRSHAELMKLPLTEDHNQFLQSFSSLSALSEPSNRLSPKISSLWYFKDVMDIMKQTRKKIQPVIFEEWPLAELPSRKDFLQHSRQITLDPNTADSFLVLSEGNRKITYTQRKKASFLDMFRPHHVLSREELTGRCYWEVEMSGDAAVAVAYRRDDGSEQYNVVFGETFWALECKRNGLNFYHKIIKTCVSGSWSSRVGVYLDHSAGLLSFYSVSETMTLLHRVQTTFTEPLYARLSLSGPDGETAELCELKSSSKSTD